jgi:3-hydroxybutyryl-CoA dehydrogenase
LVDDTGFALEEEGVEDDEFEDDAEDGEEGPFVATLNGNGHYGDDDDEDFDDDDDMDYMEDPNDPENFDIVFDLNFDEYPDNIVNYVLNEGQVVFLCAVSRPLSEMIGNWDTNMECKAFGLNAWPTFLNRAKLETSILDKADHMVLEATMKTLGLEYETVEDQVGMVGPRVLSMIINEAAFVLGEGTAEVKAVDQAMKLGTNYPQGPFEWCDRIGVASVVELLDALRDRTGDGRYKVAPALRRQAERDLLFYPQTK